VNDAAQPRTLSTQTNAVADGGKALSRPEINLPVLDTTDATSTPNKLEQVETLIKQQSQLQLKLSADLTKARTEASEFHPQDIGALVLPVGGVFLAASVCVVLAILCVRWLGHRKIARLEVEGAYSDSSQLASGYGDDVAHIDELVERFSAGRMPPEEDADARAQRVALSEVQELAPMPAELAESLETSEDIDFYLSVFDQELTDLPEPAQQAPNPSGDKVSSEVQKVLKSLAEKRLARKDQQRVLQPQVMMQYEKPSADATQAFDPKVSDPLGAIDFALDLPVQSSNTSSVALNIPPEIVEQAAQASSANLLPAAESLPAIELKPEDLKWKTLLDLALEFVKLGQYDEAVQMYNEVIEHGPAAFQDQARKRLNAVPAQR
jgi:FimV-like protein